MKLTRRLHGEMFAKLTSTGITQRLWPIRPFPPLWGIQRPAIGADVLVRDFQFFLLVPSAALLVDGDGDAGVAADEGGAGVPGADTLGALAVAVTEAGEHFDGFDVGGAFVAGHFVVDAVWFGRGVGFVEVLLRQGGVGDAGFGGWRHAVVVD